MLSLNICSLIYHLCRFEGSTHNDVASMIFFLVDMLILRSLVRDGYDLGSEGIS